MRITVKLLNMLITIVGVALFSAALLVTSAQHASTDSVQAVSTVRDGMFNPAATLDTTQITDSRPVPTDDADAEGQDVLPIAYHAAPPALWYSLGQQHPEWYDDDVADIGTYWVPIGTVLHDDDGLYMATYDGWGQCEDFVTTEGTCVRDDGTVALEMLDIEPVPATVIYGTGAGALCGTDAQCAALDADRELAGLPALDGPAYGTEQDTAQDAAQVLNVAFSPPRLAEDGSWVPADYYRHVTKTGATQARCDYLGKRRVTDPVYGHRCV